MLIKVKFTEWDTTPTTKNGVTVIRKDSDAENPITNGEGQYAIIPDQVFGDFILDLIAEYYNKQQLFANYDVIKKEIVPYILEGNEFRFCYTGTSNLERYNMYTICINWNDSTNTITIEKTGLALDNSKSYFKQEITFTHIPKYKSVVPAIEELYYDEFIG